MKNVFGFILAVIMLAGACKEKSKTTPTGKDEKVTLAKDSAEIRATVLDFYGWYSHNYEKFMRYDLYSGIKKKDAPPYQLNWEEVKKYQAFIRDSVPQLGAAFLENQQKLFKKCDSAFRVDVEDDVPAYFDYDWYTNTQEDPAYILEEMNKSKQWMMNIMGDSATVDIKGYDNNGQKPATTVINLEMKKENGQWKIARIGND